MISIRADKLWFTSHESQVLLSTDGARGTWFSGGGQFGGGGTGGSVYVSASVIYGGGVASATGAAGINSAYRTG